jgi:hypothetical protein
MPEPAGWAELRAIRATAGLARAQACSSMNALRSPVSRRDIRLLRHSPPRSRNEARARSATDSDVESFINEFREGPMAVQQAASLNDFAGKPLIVITAGRGHNAQWLSAQKDLATLSTNSRHRVVADATHGLTSSGSD